jgi:hypothetical protein
MYKEANPKPVLVLGLQGLIGAQPAVLPAAALAAAAAPAAEGSDNDEEDED